VGGGGGGLIFFPAILNFVHKYGDVSVNCSLSIGLFESEDEKQYDYFSHR
jgi:hypothetical protein